MSLCIRYCIIKPDILVHATNNLESDCYWMERRMLYVNKVAIWTYLDNSLSQEDAPFMSTPIPNQKKRVAKTF